MAGVRLTLSAYGPAPTSIDLAQPGSTTWTLMEGANWGNAAWTHTFSGPRGTQGARAASGNLPNRQVTLPLHVYGIDKDDLAANLSTLNRVVDLMRRYGGRIRWQASDQSHPNNLEVFAGTATIDAWGTQFETLNLATPLLTFDCEPLIRGDSMDVELGFDDVAELAGFTADAGDVGNLTVISGEARPAQSVAVENRLRYTQRGYAYTDHEQQLNFRVGSVLSGFRAGVILKMADPDTYIEGAIEDTGSVSRLSLTWKAGTSTATSTTNVTRLAAAGEGWVVLRQLGERVVLELYAIDPERLGLPTNSLLVTLTDPVALSALGPAAGGEPGIVWTPQHAASALMAWRVHTFVRRSQDVQFPDQTVALDLRGVPGDQPALAEVTVGQTDYGVRQWGMFAWSPLPPVHNLIWNGDFEDFDRSGASGVTPTGWGAGGLSGVVGAVTSIRYAYDATGTELGRYGRDAGQVTTTASVGSGPYFQVWRKIIRGRPMTGRVWVRSTTSTAQVRIRIGSSASDNAVGSATALATSWKQLTVAWTPTTEASVCFLSVETVAGASIVYLMDAAELFDGTTPPSLPSQTEGRGGFAPIGLIRAANNRVGTSSAFFNPANNKYESSGFGTVQGSGWGYTTTPSPSWIALQCLVDPALIGPDDYAESEVEVEVWAYLRTSSFDGPCTVYASVAPFTGLAVDARRWTAEWGSSGRVIPQSLSSDGRNLYRVGTVSMGASADYAARWQLDVTVLVPGGAGPLTPAVLEGVYLAPVRSRALGATGRTDLPAFLPSAQGYASVKRVRSDLSGVAGQAGVSLPPSPGLGGALLELPVGDVRMDLAVTTYGVIPDTGQPTASPRGQTLLPGNYSRVTVTPRYAQLRP